MDFISIDSKLIFFILTGFFAQLIAGALGMGYGTISSTILLSSGVPPVVISASVHVARLFTTLVSAISHHYLKNINTKVLRQLLIPGMIGGTIGVLILTSFPGEYIKPFMSIYLIVMGIRILFKAFNKKFTASRSMETRKISLLALVGGFLDAVCGGGWGPIVTSTLLSSDDQPRYVIGTVITAEFFVTAVEVAMFFVFITLMDWQVIIGLMLGGIISAPIGAIICKYVPAKKLMLFVGILICALSVKILIASLI